MTGKMLDAKLTISADDRTASVFKDIEARVNRIATAMNSIGRVGSSVNGVSREVDKAATAVNSMERAFWQVTGEIRRAERQVGGLGRAITGLGGIARSVGSVVGGALGLDMVGEAAKGVRASANVETAKARLALAGAPAKDIAAADAASGEIMRKYPNLSHAAILDSYRELRSVVSHPDEALPLLDFVSKVKSTMEAAGGSSEHLVYAEKAAEKLGKANDPQQFKNFLEAALKGQQILGVTSDPEDMLTAARGARTEGMLLSDRFLTTTMISLNQALGAPGTGKALANFGKVVSGAGLQNNHSALLEWKALGFLKDSDFTKTKHGELKGLKPGHNIRGYKKAIRDPDKFLYEDILPEMVRQGTVDPIEQDARLQKMFPGSTAAGILSELRGNRQMFEGHAQQYERGMGAEGGKYLMQHDPTAALTASMTALENAIATQLAPLVGPFTAACARFTEFLGAYSKARDEFNKTHPHAAPWVAAGESVAEIGAGAYVGKKILEGGLRAVGLGGRTAAAGGAEVAGAGILGTLGAIATSPLALAGGMLVASTTPALAGEDERGRQLRLQATEGAKSFDALKAADVGRVSPGLLAFGVGGPGAAMPTRLEGAADINLKIEVTADTDAIVRRVEQSMSAFGALRSGTGVSMPEASPGGGSGSSR
ncbi:hypothetical protein RZS28_04040 [Methylocapsa polymorpha]|uniref:Phage tail tape measure protein domain-containing protein n=1 Tax=Methylocapsa polymorpha TaxID=3080828 RepID=A0ABZ0HU71_9HYPH|nr:hypothetical protein RZS28_04040 [Methylocapsa sp. RX1]